MPSRGMEGKRLRYRHRKGAPGPVRRSAHDPLPEGSPRRVELAPPRSPTGPLHSASEAMTGYPRSS